MAENQSKPSESEPKPAEGDQAPLGNAASAAAEALASEEIAQLRAELEDFKDRALRGWAELENYRKRAGRQIEEERRYAALPLVRDLLPALDNMRRAIDAAEKTHDAASLLEGIKMVMEQIEVALARHHCTPIPALHRPFDPNVHDAIMHQPSTEFPPNTVLQEVQQGFQMHDRVVRPAQVIVSSPAEEPKKGP